MKTQETTVKVLSKETKTGTTNGHDWTIDNYTVLEEVEREDGSVAETKVVCSTTQAVGDLAVGAKYNVVIFITSRETEKDGKKQVWNSFRITRAELVGELPANETNAETAVSDNIPF